MTCPRCGAAGARLSAVEKGARFRFSDTAYRETLARSGVIISCLNCNLQRFFTQLPPEASNAMDWFSSSGYRHLRIPRDKARLLPHPQE